MTFAIAQNEELFELILDGLADAVVVVDSQQQVVFANKALTELFGLKRDPVGRDIMEVALDHRISAVIEAALEANKTVRKEITLHLSRKGVRSEAVVMINAKPVSAGGGHTLVRVILRDDTARVETEQVRRDFVANASHELRTPLSIINGYIENLADGAVEDPPLARRFLAVMKKHGDRIARIVEDMLTISKFESAQEDPTLAGVFDLHSCARDVIERLQPLIEDKEADVTLVAEASEASIAGDRFYWDQIFFNLVENALKQNQRPGLKIVIAFKSLDERYRITVTDDGVGIPQADLPFIFKRFYRVEKHHSKEIKGTGLGLSIVKRAIEAHRGTVSATSSPGEHTTFEIIVPQGDLSVAAES